jgi:hypothetical protein
MVDLGKTLNQLEGSHVERPTFSSHLVTACHALRQKPLKDFTIEDLRIMIGQNLGMEFLVPMAIDRLEKDPLAEGDFYPGDLLKSVLSAEPGFWKTHTDLRRRVAQVTERAMKLIEEQGDDQVAKKALAEGIRMFHHSEK